MSTAVYDLFKSASDLLSGAASGIGKILPGKKKTKKALKGIFVNKVTKTAAHAISVAVVNNKTRPIGGRIRKVFNAATGYTSLEKRGLYRGTGGDFLAAVTPVMTLEGAAITALFLAPVAPPLAVVFAAAAGAAVVGLGPLRLNAAYIKGRQERINSEQAKKRASIQNWPSIPV